MQVTPEGIELIKHFEGLHDGDLHKIGLSPKMCPAGVWTVGYGHALQDKYGKPLKGDLNKTVAYASCKDMTIEDADKLLAEDLAKFSAQLKPLIHIFCGDAMFSACVSLAYNIGVGAFAKSTVLREMNKGNKQVAANAFLLWNKGTLPNGKKVVLAGLTRRRNAERALFLGQDYKQFFV